MAGDPLTIAVGATALAGLALALWGWRDIRDAFAARANARARLGLSEEMAAARKLGRRKSCIEQRHGTQHNGGTHNVAARKLK